MSDPRFTLSGAHRLFAARPIVVLPEMERRRLRERRLARVAQFIRYGFGVIYSLLAIRLALVLLDAWPRAGFVRLINAATDPFYAPFRGIVKSPPLLGGSHPLSVPILIAIVAYAVLHAGINALLRLIAHRRQEL